MNAIIALLGKSRRPPVRPLVDRLLREVEKR
jgi:hypothetical protein